MQTCLVIQLEKRTENHWKVNIIDEVLGKYPHNTPRATALLFAKKYKAHRSTIRRAIAKNGIKPTHITKEMSAAIRPLKNDIINDAKEDIRAAIYDAIKSALR